MANTKMPRLLAFARHVEMVIIEALKPRSTNIDDMPDNVRRDGYIGVFGDGTCLAMPETRLSAGLIVIEAWFRGY